jgi:hypothetical protein
MRKRRLAHRYNHAITVTVANGLPTTIRWHDVAYRVAQVNEPWRLIDRWWRSDATGAQGSEQNRSERTYYRVQCVSAAGEDLTCDIYCEAVSGVWVLERVYD